MEHWYLETFLLPPIFLPYIVLSLPEPSEPTTLPGEGRFSGVLGWKEVVVYELCSGEDFEEVGESPHESEAWSNVSVLDEVEI